MIFTAKRVPKSAVIYPVVMAILVRKYGKGTFTNMHYWQGGGYGADHRIKGKMICALTYVTVGEVSLAKAGGLDQIKPFDHSGCLHFQK